MVNVSSVPGRSQDMSGLAVSLPFPRSLSNVYSKHALNSCSKYCEEELQTYAQRNECGPIYMLT